MSNMDKAKSFLLMAGTGKVKEAYEQFIAANFIHHNQYFKGDRQSLLNAMEEAHKTSPNKSIEIKKVYEDGNTVITHSLVKKTEQDIAVVHIFRFENGKVVELWDLGMLIMKDGPNEHGLF